MKLLATSQMVPGSGLEDSMEQESFPQKHFYIISFRQRRKCNSAVQAGTQFGLRTQRTISVLWARKLEQVPEFLATVLVLVSLALAKGFFFSLVRVFCLVGFFWCFLFCWYLFGFLVGEVWGCLFVCLFNLSMGLHAYLLLLFFRWRNLFPTFIQLSLKGISLHVLNYYLSSPPVSSRLNALGDMANSYCFFSWFTGK